MKIVSWDGPSVVIPLPSRMTLLDLNALSVPLTGRNIPILVELLKVNNLDTVSKDIVAAARDSLVIGQV